MKLFIILSVAFASVRAECPDLVVGDNTIVTCSNGTFAGSECVAECDEGYAFLPPTNGPQQPTTTCQDDDTWDNVLPFCGLVCPASAKADIVFLVDSSGSMRGVTGDLMRTFLKEMIGQWTISSEYVNVAIVPYNEDIMRNSVVTLTQFTDDKDGLLEYIDTLPRNGRGSKTAKALGYAGNVILAGANGNRPDAPDIIIVMSDGRGQDGVDPPLGRLWARGVNTYSVGFHPRRRRMPLLTRQLMKIAQGNPSRMHITERNAIGNTEAFMNDLADVYCDEAELPDTCEPPRDTLANGDIVCTNNNTVGSRCTFECNAGYTLTPETVTENTCQATGEWDADQPCCLIDCPPNARMDGIIVLDSSSSIGADNWALMKTFTRNFMSAFTISSEAVNFAVVRYNRAVDTENIIFLNSYPDDKDGLLEAFDQIPYDGSGTKTGQALTYVSENMMSAEAGNRPGVPDIVFVITDGKSSDDVLGPSEQLRRQGATVLSIGITPRRGSLDLNQLREIGGDERNVILVEGGFEALEAAFETRVTQQVCLSQC